MKDRKAREHYLALPVYLQYNSIVNELVQNQYLCFSLFNNTKGERWNRKKQRADCEPINQG